MKYLQIEFGNNHDSSKEPWWVKLLKRIIPPANPDLEPLYDNVTKWWLEVDENGEPIREIGFDNQDQAIVLGPIGENYGLLVDTGKVWDDKVLETPGIEETFEPIWQELASRFKKLEIKDNHSVDRTS